MYYLWLSSLVQRTKTSNHTEYSFSYFNYKRQILSRFLAWCSVKNSVVFAKISTNLVQLRVGLVQNHGCKRVQRFSRRSEYFNRDKIENGSVRALCSNTDCDVFQNQFIVDDVSKIIKEAIETSIGGTAYQHNKVNQWTSTVVETCLGQLTKLQKPYKYIGKVNVVTFFTMCKGAAPSR